MTSVEQRRASDRERQRRWRQANREAARKTARDRYESGPELTLARVNRHAERVRTEVFAHYGTACACCSTTDDLTIDHIDGRGREHRRETFGHHRRGTGTRFYVWLRSNGFPPGFQTLCRRCNRSKGDDRRCFLPHL